MSTSYSNGSTTFVVVAALLTVGVSASPANAWQVATRGVAVAAGHGVARHGSGARWGEAVRGRAAWGVGGGSAAGGADSARTGGGRDDWNDDDHQHLQR